MKIKKKWIIVTVFFVFLPMGIAAQQRTKATQSSRPSSTQTTRERNDTLAQKVSSPDNKNMSGNTNISSRASSAKKNKADAQLTPKERARQHRQPKKTQTKK